MQRKTAKEQEEWQMGERQIVMPYEELDQIQVICQCGSGVIADARKEGAKISNGCPGCGESLELAGYAVSKYRTFFAAAGQAKPRILFRIKST